jgi:hypothetical protein
MTNLRCQSSDRGCPAHPGISFCIQPASTTLFRIDMEDQTGTAFCDACAEDAMNSGLFSEVR